MLETIKALWRDEEGATLVEYALMLALIAIVCILVVAAVGTKSAQTFDKAQTEIAPRDPIPATP